RRRGGEVRRGRQVAVGDDRQVPETRAGAGRAAEARRGASGDERLRRVSAVLRQLPPAAPQERVRLPRPVRRRVGAGEPEAVRAGPGRVPQGDRAAQRRDRRPGAVPDRRDVLRRGQVRGGRRRTAL
ncbi:MAG: hypothetical protein AVDCRST_MAG64-239, partial [uncultured Phycisphaerae bacterium]